MVRRLIKLAFRRSRKRKWGAYPVVIGDHIVFLGGRDLLKVPVGYRRDRLDYPSTIRRYSR